VNYHGTEKVYQYVIKDTMPSASVVDLNEGSYEVTITDGSGNITTLTQGSEKATGKYNLLEENNNFTITIPWAATNTPTGNTQNGANDDFFYKGINTITVTYTGVLKSGAKPGSADLPENTNIATINPNTSNDDPGQKVTVRDGQITIKKIDGSTKASLQGAIFVLKNATGQFLNFNDTNNVEWGTEANATEYTTGADGIITITGLKEGTYYLVEKKAPLGYNLLDNSQKVILGDGATDTTNSDNLLVNPTVENNKGTELPSTGGIGTTIFYIIGAILVIGAGIVLVARRRLRS
ncbi:SpaH/EbpB family LPXTG-anchored major pilin, partial [Streptococcus agalactiae]|nr:SpaH/EbpB family LPXTG-anchored major pilin [Streptococcus agalactiae]